MLLIIRMFISLHLNANIQNLVKLAQWFLRKASFDFHNVNDLGSRSRNDLDLQYINIMFVCSTVSSMLSGLETRTLGLKTLSTT